jgi:hypothetical protein
LALLVMVLMGIITPIALAPQAGAAGCSVTLQVRRSFPDYEWFEIRGVVPMNEADAWGYLIHGAWMYIEMWGDDPTYDDHILSSPVVYRNEFELNMRATPNGIEFDWFPSVTHSKLNEDWGEDEIYVNAVVFAGNRSLLCDVESRRLVRYF